MIDWILNFQFNGLLGIILFWLPLSLCCYGYTVKTWLEYQSDVKNRDGIDTYYPDLTIGVIIGRALVSIIPIANLWAAVFDVAPKVFNQFFKLIGRVFNQPLVPKRKQEKDS